MAKSKSKSKSKDFQSYEPTVFEAPRRSVLQEGREGLQLMGEAYPQILALNERFGSAFARNEVDVASARGKAEAGAIKENYGGLRDSLLSSPEVAKANTALNARFDELGPSEIEGELGRQALDELKLGGALTPEEARSASQAARAAFSARGLATGSPAAVAEVLSRDSFGRQRQTERRAFASGVDLQRTQRKTADAATNNNLFNTATSFWDPQMRLFGRGGSQVSGQVSGPSSFAPFLGASQAVGAGNQQAAVATDRLNAEGERFAQERNDQYWYSLWNAGQANQNAAAQRKSANTSAAISGAASIASMAALAFLM